MMLVAVAMSGLVQQDRYISCPITFCSHSCFSLCSWGQVYSSLGMRLLLVEYGLSVGCASCSSQKSMSLLMWAVCDVNSPLSVLSYFTPKYQCSSPSYLVLYFS